MKKLIAIIATLLISLGSMSAPKNNTFKSNSIAPWNKLLTKKLTTTVSAIQIGLLGAEFSQSGYPELVFFVVFSEYTDNRYWRCQVPVYTYWRRLLTWRWDWISYSFDVDPYSNGWSYHRPLYSGQQFNMLDPYNLDPAYYHVYSFSPL